MQWRRIRFHRNWLQPTAHPRLTCGSIATDAAGGSVEECVCLSDTQMHAQLVFTTLAETTSITWARSSGQDLNPHWVCTRLSYKASCLNWSIIAEVKGYRHRAWMCEGSAPDISWCVAARGQSCCLHTDLHIVWQKQSLTKHHQAPPTRFLHSCRWRQMYIYYIYRVTVSIQ